MTPDQFDAFRRQHETECLFNRTGVKSVDASYTAEDAGVYFLVVDNNRYRYVNVDQSANITTSVFQVSNATAVQVCSDNCTFKGVRSDECVIVGYTGPELFVNTTVYHGRKKLPSGCLISVIVLSVFVGVLLATFVALLVIVIKRSKASKSVPVSDAPVENAIVGTENSTPQEMTPEHDIETPLVPNTADDPVYYGTAPPDSA